MEQCNITDFCGQSHDSGTRTKVNEWSLRLKLSTMTQDKAPGQPMLKRKIAYYSPQPVSPVLKHFCHQGRRSGTRTKVRVSSHLVRLSKMTQKQRTTSSMHTSCTQSLNCIRQPQASQSRLETLCHQGRSSGTRTKVNVSSHVVRLYKKNQDNAPQAPCIPVARKH